VPAGIFLHDADTFLECRLLIAHPNRPRVLTIRQTEPWALPALTPLEQHVAAVQHINLAVLRLFGLKTYVRRLVFERPHDAGGADANAVLRCYELELISELERQRISRTVWAGRSVLDEISFESEIDRETIELWLKEFESTEDADVTEATSMTGRTAWSRPGWYETASSWMRRQAAGRDALTQAAPDQHWTDDEIVLLSSHSNSGLVVMTATDSTDAPEPSEWASWFGWTEPELIINDAGRNWSLYRTSSGQS
jgi:muconolactone delta-isomerase